MNAKDISEALTDIDEQYVAEALTYRRKPLWHSLAAAAACLCLLAGLLIPGTTTTSTPLYPDGSTDPTLATAYTAYYAEGISLEGLILPENSGVVVEDLQITLTLTEDPLALQPTSENTAAMAYTLHNPTEEPITLTLTLPCGPDPRYADSYAYETGKELFEANRHLYTATANGEALDLTLRMTGNDTPPVAEGQWRFGLFSNETTVTAITYEVTALDCGDSGCLSIWNPSSGEAVALLDEEWSGHVTNGNTEEIRSVAPGSTFTVYVFGNAEAFNPGWRFYTDRTKAQTASGTVEAVNTQEMTMAEFAAQSWDSGSGVSLDDWACTLAARLHHASLYSAASYSQLEYLTERWFQYELNLAPGETVVNTVTLPVYLTVSSTYYGEHSLHCHVDLLSLRMAQPQTGPTITINTPYAMSVSSQTFTETDTGYCLDMTQIYQVSLDFNLVSREAQEPTANTADWQCLKWALLTAGAAMLIFLFFRKKSKP